MESEAQTTANQGEKREGEVGDESPTKKAATVAPAPAPPPKAPAAGSGFEVVHAVSSGALAEAMALLGETKSVGELDTQTLMKAMAIMQTSLLTNLLAPVGQQMSGLENRLGRHDVQISQLCLKQTEFTREFWILQNENRKVFAEVQALRNELRGGPRPTQAPTAVPSAPPPTNPYAPGNNNNSFTPSHALPPPRPPGLQQASRDRLSEAFSKPAFVPTTIMVFELPRNKNKGELEQALVQLRASLTPEAQSAVGRPWARAGNSEKVSFGSFPIRPGTDPRCALELLQAEIQDKNVALLGHEKPMRFTLEQEPARRKAGGVAKQAKAVLESTGVQFPAAVQTMGGTVKVGDLPVGAWNEDAGVWRWHAARLNRFIPDLDKVDIEVDPDFW